MCEHTDLSHNALCLRFTKKPDQLIHGRGNQTNKGGPSRETYQMNSGIEVRKKVEDDDQPHAVLR